MSDLAVAYEVESTIEGHSRELYVVKRQGDHRRYIMAIFELRPEDREAVEGEIARCVELAHPAVVPVVDAFEHDDNLVLVFEKVEGVTLQRLLENLGSGDEPLSDAAVFHIAANLFAALEVAHTARDPQGVVVPLVHAELGPHQVFIAWDGSVQLLGVGLSTLFRLAAANQLNAPAAVPFVAPEIHMGGSLTVRANVYSAAAMIWALLARQLPPTDGSVAPKLGDVRPDLDRAVINALDHALMPSLLQRRITAGTLAGVFSALAADGAQKLSWGIDVLRAIDTFDESLFGIESLPAPKLSEAPTESLPSLLPIANDDVAFSSLPPSSEGIPISILPPSFDPLDDAPTIPPQAPTPPTPPPPPPKKR